MTHVKTSKNASDSARQNVPPAAENPPESPWIPRPQTAHGERRKEGKPLPRLSFRPEGKGRVALAEDIVEELARLIVEAHDRDNAAT